MCTCARLATARSARPKYGASRNSLKPCFVEKRTGTRATVPASRPYASACTRCVCRIAGRMRTRYATSRTNAIGSTSARSGIASSGTPRAGERAREVPRAGLVLVQHQHADVPAALAQPRQQREQVRLRAGDAGDLLQVEDGAALHRSPTVASTPSAQCSTEWSRRDELAQLRAAPRGRAPRSRVGEALRVVAVEAELVGQQVVEDRVRREHRQARRGGLVDDLVGRARAHVVDQDVAAREERRNLGARHRAAELGVEPELAREPLELALVRVVLAVAGRAVRLDADAAGERRAAQDRLEPLRRRVAAEHERAQRPPSAGARRLHGNSATSMPWPIAAHLARRERERAPVDGDDRRADLLRRRARRRAPSSACTRARAGSRRGRTSGAASTA